MNGKTYLIVVFGILLAKALGFGRNIIFASAFGASTYTDIYFQIFGIASFVFAGIGTSLATLVIKNMNKAENRGEEQKKSYVSHFICKIGVIVLAVTAILYLAADPIVRILLPGLEDSLYGVARKMMYIMLPSGFFVIIAYIMSGVLQNCKVFFITSIMSLPYNVIIISALLAGETDIMTISWITTLGWFLHIVILLPSFYRKGFRFFYRGKAEGPMAKERNQEVFYIFISSIMFHMCFVFDKAAMSHDTGAASTINYATNLFVTIASIFVVAMSNVSFPSISRSYEKGDTAAVQKTTHQLIALLFAIILPFILVVCFSGEDLIRLLYERGKFTSALTRETALLFIIYTFGIFGYVCQELFNKILYLGSCYRYPVIGSVLIMVLKPLINLWASTKSVYAVAITTTLLFTLYAVLIGWALTRIAGTYLSKDLGQNLLKILFAGVAMTAVYLLSKILPLPDTKLTFLPVVVLAGVVYLAVLWFTGIIRTLLLKKEQE